MYPKIYIINLESSTDRKSYMDEQFKVLSEQHPDIQLDINYFPAVHGIKNPEHPVLKNTMRKSISYVKDATFLYRN